MKKHLSKEELIRAVIRNAEEPLQTMKETLRELALEGNLNSAMYMKVVLALTYIKELKKELGDYIDPVYKTELKQIEIPY
jgi:predicted DNA-binding helix-hairpin-helix protein